MATISTVFTQNDQTITLTGLSQTVAGVVTPITGAVVTFTLTDSTGTALLTAQPMTDVPGAAGNYAGAIQQTFNPSPINNPMTMIIIAVSGGKTFTVAREVMVKARTI